jgi:HK97 family phage portal protein
MWPFKPKEVNVKTATTKAMGTKAFNNSSPYTIENMFERYGNGTDGSTLTEAMACVRVKSNAVSQCPVIIEQKQQDGTWKSADELTDPVMKALMIQPNPIQTWSDWLSQLVQEVELKGNFSTWNAFTKNTPTKFEPFINNTGVSYNYDSSRGVKYATVVTNAGKSLKVDMPDRRLSHFLNPVTHQGIRGYSTLTAAALKMGLLEQNMMADIIGNYDAPTSGFIEMPIDVETDHEYAETLKAQIKDGDGLVLLTDGARFNDARLSPVDMQLLESKSFNRETVCALYGVPVGLISPSTQSDGADDMLKLHSLAVAPFIHKIESTMNLVMPETWRFRLDDAAFTRGDRQTQIDNEATLIQRGLSTLGESADRLGIKCNVNRRDLMAIETNNIQLGTPEYIQEIQNLNNDKLRAEIDVLIKPKETTNEAPPTEPKAEI